MLAVNLAFCFVYLLAISAVIVAAQDKRIRRLKPWQEYAMCAGVIGMGLHAPIIIGYWFWSFVNGG